MPEQKVYIYVVDRDFGFAPNPFNGFCTLACCKPKIRSVAKAGDWVFGIGGTRLKATGKCIYGMQVSEHVTFDEYWADTKFRAKRPIRNGSRTVMLGDNIYHRDGTTSPWQQEDSHHSRPDGSPDVTNITNDTQKNKVLISNRFIYFGSQAPLVPEPIFDEMGYENRRAHRTYKASDAVPLLNWFEAFNPDRADHVRGDPFQFRQSGARYSSGTNKIIT